MLAKSVAGYEGPRPPTLAEWSEVLAFQHSVFFSDTVEGDPGLAAWPMGLRSDTLCGTLAMFHGGSPVSAIARFDRDILVRGHRLRVAYIGGVATHAEHRGRGLASTILAAMVSRCAADGVDFVHISGTQGLYYGAGADHIGAEDRFPVPADRHGQGRIDVRAATVDDAIAIAGMAQRESVRSLRPLQDYEVVLAAGYCAGSPCRFHLVTHGGRAVACVLVWGREGAEEAIEVAGERGLALEGLATLARRLGRALPVRLPRGDALGDVLRAEGVAGEVVASEGTVKLVSFAATMARLRPYFHELMPDLDVAALDAADCDGRYVAWSGTGVLQCEDERAALWTLAGAPPGAEVHASASGSLAQLQERALPLPLPSFALNMI